jgi:Rap1a immunity proteins
MRRFRFCAFALTFLLTPNVVQGQAQAQTGRDLLIDCQNVPKIGMSDSMPPPSSTDIRKAAYCLGYLQGAREILQIWEASNKAKASNLPPIACISSESTTQELAMVVVKYLNDHPNKLHEGYTLVAFTALEEAYPCNQSK